MSVLSIPTHCLINLHETERPWHAAGTVEECWRHLLSTYGACTVHAVLSMGWRCVPVRIARRV